MDSSLRLGKVGNSSLVEEGRDHSRRLWWLTAASSWSTTHNGRHRQRQCSTRWTAGNFIQKHGIRTRVRMHRPKRCTPKGLLMFCRASARRLTWISFSTGAICSLSAQLCLTVLTFPGFGVMMNRLVGAPALQAGSSSTGPPSRWMPVRCTAEPSAADNGKESMNASRPT